LLSFKDFRDLDLWDCYIARNPSPPSPIFREFPWPRSLGLLSLKDFCCRPWGCVIARYSQLQVARRGLGLGLRTKSLMFWARGAAQGSRLVAWTYEERRGLGFEVWLWAARPRARSSRLGVRGAAQCLELGPQGSGPRARNSRVGARGLIEGPRLRARGWTPGAHGAAQLSGLVALGLLEGGDRGAARGLGLGL
jgi:hypothetical protein